MVLTPPKREFCEESNAAAAATCVIRCEFCLELEVFHETEETIAVTLRNSQTCESGAVQ